MRGRRSEVVQPAAVAVVARHDAADHPITVDRDEEQLRLHGELATDIGARVVPRARKARLLPQAQIQLTQRIYGGARRVVEREGADVDRHGHSSDRDARMPASTVRASTHSASA